MYFQLWQYDDVPLRFRQMVPGADSGWWFAFVPAANCEIAQILAELWQKAGYSVAEYGVPEPGVLIAGCRLLPSSETAPPS